MIKQIIITDPSTTFPVTFKFENNPNQLLYFNNLFFDDLTLKQQFFELAYFGSFRCAKSFSQQLAAWLICIKYPKARGLFIRDTYDQLKDSVIKQFCDDFDRFKQFRFVDREARFANDSLIKFRTFEKDTNILSTEYDFICVCQLEDISEELFLQLMGRLSGSRLGRPLLLTEGNPAPNYVKRRYKDSTADELASKGIFAITNGQTLDNKDNIPAGYIEQLRSNYPDWWFRRYVLSEWDNYSDLVFSEFNDGIVVDQIDPEKIAKHWRKAQGMDYGFVNPTAILWAYKDYDGVITIWDEYYESKRLTDYIALQVKRHKAYDNEPVVADYAIKNNKTGNNQRPDKTMWDDFLDEGLMMVESNKNEYRNILNVNRMMKTGMLRITRNCVNLITEIKGYKWKTIKLGAKSNLPEQPVDRDNHCLDSMCYLISYLGDSVSSIDKDKIAEEKKTIAYMTTHRKKEWKQLG